MSLFEDIPGYREAIREESERRDEAFAGLPDFICGIEVRPLSMRHLLYLRGIRSPFVSGGIPGPADVALFLWCVSPNHHAALRMRDALEPWIPRLARWLFNRVRRRFFVRCRKLHFAQTVEAIAQFVADARQDAPGEEKGRGFEPSYYSSIAVVIRRMAQNYSLTQAAVIDMPLRCLYQHLRVLLHEVDEKAIFFNPSDKVRSAHLKKLNEAKKHD